jgi:hypothetical protein
VLSSAFPSQCAQHSARPHGFGCGPQSAPLQCGCFPQCLTAAYGEACVFVCAAHRSSRSQRSMGGRSNHSTPWPTVATCALSVGAPQIALSANGTLRTSGTVASRCIRLHRGAFGCIAVRCAVLQAVVVSIDPKRVYAPLHCAVVGPASLVHASLLSDSHGGAATPQCAKHDSNL